MRRLRLKKDSLSSYMMVNRLSAFFQSFTGRVQRLAMFCRATILAFINLSVRYYADWWALLEVLHQRRERFQELLFFVRTQRIGRIKERWLPQA